MHSPQHDGYEGKGSVYEYSVNDKNWSDIGDEISSMFPSEQLGSVVALSADGSLVAISGLRKGDNHEGVVRVFWKYQKQHLRLG